MVEKLIVRLKQKIESALDKYEGNLYISNIRDIIVSVCLPMALTGSIFYIAANPPQGTSIGLFQMWVSAAYELKEQLMIPYYLTYGMIGIAASFMMAYCIARVKNLDPLLSALISVISFLALCLPGVNPEDYSIETLVKITGPNGLLIGFMVAIVCVKILQYFESGNIYFAVKKGLSPALSYSFKNMFPIMIIVPLMWLTGWVIGSFSGQPLPIGLATFFGHSASLGTDLVPELMSSLTTSMLYLIGMDGSMIEQPVYSVFSNMGGFGTLLPVMILFSISSSRHLKQVGTLTIIPGLFNMPYPFLLAVPVILNPIYAIPFILHPMISSVLSYMVVSSGLLAVPVEATSTMPLLFSGYFAARGHILGIILQILNIALAGIIYYPFYRYHELRLVRTYGAKDEKADVTIPYNIKIKNMANNFQSRLISNKTASSKISSNKKGRPLVK